jgi:hypothetical protein
VHPHPLGFGGGERTGLVDDRGRQAVHTEVMDQRRAAKGGHLILGQTAQLGCSGRQA